MAWVDLDRELAEMFDRLVINDVPKDSCIASRKKDEAYYERRRRWIREYYAKNEAYRERRKMLERQRRAFLKATNPEWVEKERERNRRRKKACST